MLGITNVCNTLQKNRFGKSTWYNYVCNTLQKMTKPIQEKFYQQVGERICHARKEVGMKQEALASFLELSRASVVNIEKGRQHPSLYQINEIARILNVSVESLIPESSAPETKSKSSWQKIINKKVRDKESSEKILGFVTGLSS